MAAGDGGVFISYRRDDTAWPAARLYDLLAARLGPEHVFKDIDNIEPGQDFVERITSAVTGCDAALVLIGPRWATITDAEGRRRLDDPDDFVRLEVATALARGILVIPILVDDADMPAPEALPTELAGLSRRQAVDIDPAQMDIDKLMRVLAPVLGVAPGRGGATAARPWLRPVIVGALVVAVAALVAVPLVSNLWTRSPGLIEGTPAPTLGFPSRSSAPTAMAPSAPVGGAIGVGERPVDLVVDWVGNRVYVANSGDGTVSVIDTATNQLVGTIEVGGQPMAVVVESPAQRAYVADAASGTVAIIDTAAQTVTGSIAVGLEPSGMVVDEVTRRLYVANAGEDTVSVVDTRRDVVIATVAVGQRPVALALDSAAGLVLVATIEDDRPSQIDVASNVASPIPAGDVTSDVVVDSRANRTVWAFPGTSEVALVGQDTIAIPVGKGPSSLAVDTGADRLFVANTLDDTVTTIATSAEVVLATVAVGDGPTAVAVDTDTHRLFVANTNDDSVSVIDP